MNNIFRKAEEKIKKCNFLFIFFITFRNYSFYFLNKISHYQLEKIRFYKEIGYRLNLKNPKSCNEKIVWKKINDRNPLLPITADKYKVRSYIKKIMGEEKAKELLIPLLYVTDKPETIPFENLPSAFIVKPNHASGKCIKVENSHFDKNDMIKTCRRWLKIPYGLDKLEWAYQPIKRKIVVERFLRDKRGNLPMDFKFHMYHGKCKSITVFVNRKTNRSKSAFDEKWNSLLMKNPKRPEEPKIRKPKNFEKMLEIAEELSKPFDYIRVDLYNIDGKIHFGELTHYPKSGRRRFEPSSLDMEYGEYWKIKPGYWTADNHKPFSID